MDHKAEAVAAINSAKVHVEALRTNGNGEIIDSLINDLNDAIQEIQEL